MPFVLRRLGFFVVTFWAAVSLNFFIPRAVPGNAVQTIMAKFPTLQPSAYRALAAMLGVCIIILVFLVIGWMVRLGSSGAQSKPPVAARPDSVSADL